MNLVSPVMKFLTPDMTGRIASALGLDHITKRLMLIVCSAICLGLAFPTPSFAQKKSLATCEKEWRDNKAFNQAAGITERDWLAKCRLVRGKKPADAAASVSVPLKKFQVNAVCGGIDWCEKVCGLGGQYRCRFGCGLEGCSGQCINCSSRRVSARTIQTVVANAKRPWD